MFPVWDLVAIGSAEGGGGGEGEELEEVDGDELVCDSSLGEFWCTIVVAWVGVMVGGGEKENGNWGESSSRMKEL